MIARTKETWLKRQARRDRLHAKNANRKAAKQRRRVQYVPGDGVTGPSEFEIDETHDRAANNVRGGLAALYAAVMDRRKQ